MWVTWCQWEFLVNGDITKWEFNWIYFYFIFKLNRSCSRQSFNDDGTVRMSLLSVSIESVSSSTMGSLQYTNIIHDGRQTRLPGSGICCLPTTTTTTTRELDTMEWFVRFTRSTHPPNHTPLQQQQQQQSPVIVFFFTDGLSYLMISQVSFLSSLYQLKNIVTHKITIWDVIFNNHTHTQTDFFVFFFCLFIGKNKTGFLVSPHFCCFGRCRRCCFWVFYVVWFIFLLCVCLEKGAVIRRWPCLIPQLFSLSIFSQIHL